MKRSIFVSLTLLILIVCAGIASAQMNLPWEKERFAYVTNEGDHNLMVLDLEQEKTIATLETDKAPHSLVFDNDGKGYVNNRESNVLTVIDGNNFEVIEDILLPATSFQLELSPDKKTLAVGYKDALIVSFIDTKTLEPMASVPIGRQPAGTEITRMKHPYWSNDGKYLYVGDNVNQTVVKVDVQSFDVASTIPVAGTVHHFVLDKE
ncbi:MAG: cytochrome D1 domain-containing protein, partial [Cyanobacteriota bacterium]|nr:cytochrome D1 domain-containing protein [Cyanobacteriota bacterium]